MLHSNKNNAWETTKTYYRIDRRQIAFFRFILEACDHLAVVTTLDAKKGLIQVRVAPGCETDLAAIVAALKPEILIVPIHEPVEEAMETI